MLSRAFLSRALVVAFMILVGYSLAMNIKSGTWIGTILSVVSFIAGTYCLHLLGSLQEGREKEDAY